MAVAAEEECPQSRRGLNWTRRKGVVRASKDLQSYLGDANREVVSLALALYAGTTQLPPTPKVPDRS